MKIWNCPRCRKKSLTIKIDKKSLKAEVLCGNCNFIIYKKTNRISEAIDVYGDFIDDYYNNKNLSIQDLKKNYEKPKKKLITDQNTLELLSNKKKNLDDSKIENIDKKEEGEDVLFKRFKQTQQKFKQHMNGITKQSHIKIHSPEYEKLSLEEKFKVTQAKFHERKKRDLVDTETKIEISSDMAKEDQVKLPESKHVKKKKISPQIISYGEKIKIHGNFYDLNEIWLVIDGANVAFTRKTTHYQGKLSNLTILRKKLQILGVRKFKILCDRSLYHKIDEPLEYRKMVQNGEIIETPAGTEADFFILNFAKEKGGFVISNDRFRDHYNDFGKKWIKNKRITFTFIEDNVYFDKIYNK